MKNILDKINRADEIQANKVELGTHEVELGLIENIQKDYAKYSKSQLNGNKQTDSAQQAAKQAIDSYQQAIKDYALVIQQINYAKKQATDLGVSLPASLNQIDKEINSGITYMNNRIKNLTIATKI